MIPAIIPITLHSMRGLITSIKKRLFVLKVIGPLLIPVCLYWWIQSWICHKLNIATKDNCFTWAIRNFEYANGDGICLHRSISAWFPHIVIIKNMRSTDREYISIIEYIPVDRIDGIASPPHKFNGYVKQTNYKVQDIT